MNLKKPLNCIIGYIACTTLLLLLLTTAPVSVEASVSPPRIKIETKPRKTVPFTIAVKNKNDSERSYQVSYSYYTQDKDGYQKVVQAENDTQIGPWNWIKLDSGMRFKVPSKETLSINGILTIPSRNSLGFHNAMIEVTEFTPQKKTGVTLNYTTGTLLELTVASSKKRPKTELLNPVITVDKESVTSNISMEFNNKSAYKGRLFLDMQIWLDKERKKRIATVPLLTPQAQQSEQSYSSIFPKNKVKLIGQIDQILEPGDYEIRVKGKFNGVRLRTFTQKITVDKTANPVTKEKTDTQIADTSKNSDSSMAEPVSVPLANQQ